MVRLAQFLLSRKRAELDAAGQQETLPIQP